MNRTLHLSFFAALVLLAGSARALDVDRYAWEFPRVTGIPEVPVASLKAQLVEQIDDILAAGNLTPWRVNHADEFTDAYFVYLEPGRIITTLAWAYPHLPADRQAAVKRYVHEQFKSETFAP